MKNDASNYLGFALTVVLGCGGTITQTSDGGSDAAPPVDAPVDVVVADVSPPPIGGQTFAVHDLFLGESDRNGNVSSVAWKNYGRNIDGLTTTSQSTDVCTLAAGAPLVDQVDGNNGIDNAWGEIIMPIIQSAASLPSPSLLVSANIHSGASTLLIDVTGLTPDPTQTATSLFAQLFGGAMYSGTPTFDVTTVWPVLASSVVDGKTVASGGTAQFPGSSITSGTFTTPTSSAPIELSFVLQGSPLPLKIHVPVISFDHSDASDLVNGTISGVLDTNEFIASLQALAGSISVSLCGSAFDGIAQQIRQAQDIMIDGTNAQGASCNGISIGLGFSAKLVANPNAVVPDPTPVDPCL